MKREGAEVLAAAPPVLLPLPTNGQSFRPEGGIFFLHLVCNGGMAASYMITITGAG